MKKSDAINLPVFYDQIGSFNKEVVLKHRNAIPGFDALFMEDKVNAITFKQLVEKYAITALDLIHIDTEGYDYEILKMIDFKTYTGKETLALDGFQVFDNKDIKELG